MSLPTNIAIGPDARLRAAGESSFDTAAAGNGSWIGFVEEGELHINPNLTDIFAFQARGPLKTVRGRFQPELRVRYFPTDTVFMGNLINSTSGFPSYTFELGYPTSPSPLFYRMSGGRLNRLKIRGRVGEPTEVELEALGRSVADGTTSFFTTVDAISTSDPFMFFNGQVTVNNTVAICAVEYDIDINDNLEPIYQFNERRPKAIPATRRVVEIELRQVLIDNSEFDLIKDQTSNTSFGVTIQINGPAAGQTAPPPLPLINNVNLLNARISDYSQPARAGEITMQRIRFKGQANVDGTGPITLT